MSPETVDQALQAQLDFLRDDERLRERAARAVQLSVDERLQLAYQLCRAAMGILERLPPEARARAEAYREPLGPDAEEVLRRFGSRATPG